MLSNSLEWILVSSYKIVLHLNADLSYLHGKIREKAESIWFYVSYLYEPDMFLPLLIIKLIIIFDHYILCLIITFSLFCLFRCQIM